METYVAILRGINVSGQKMIKMDDLKKHLKELPFKNIRTYIQSGNIIFEHVKAEHAGLAEQIENKITQKFGFQVPVIVRSCADLNQIINNNPFKEDTEKLYVIFLSELPQPKNIEKLMKIEKTTEQFYLFEDVIYLLCPAGYGKSKLNNNFFEQKLKVTATTRNWNTVIKLTEMSQ
jgi:uncharacterized protein (DUF1697 family)